MFVKSLYIIILLTQAIPAHSFEFRQFKSGMTISEAMGVINKNYTNIMTKTENMIIVGNKAIDITTVGFYCKKKLSQIIYNYDTNASMREFIILTSSFEKEYGESPVARTRSEFINSELGELKELSLAWSGGKTNITLSASTYSNGGGNISVVFNDTCK